MNVAEKLARQIRRVAELRHYYAESGLALLHIDAALEQGCKAAGVEDPVAQIAAGQQLEGIEA